MFEKSIEEIIKEINDTGTVEMTHEDNTYSVKVGDDSVTFNIEVGYIGEKKRLEGIWAAAHYFETLKSRYKEHEEFLPSVHKIEEYIEDINGGQYAAEEIIREITGKDVRLWDALCMLRGMSLGLKAIKHKYYSVKEK